MTKEMDYSERIFNCLPSLNPEDDWGIEDELDAAVWDEPDALPKSIDLREPWWPIHDQLQTGSCVGWATADSVLRWHFVKAGRIDEKTMLSVRYIWMAAKESDEFISRPTSFIERSGTSLKAALNVVRKFGVVTEDVLPFSASHLFPDTTKKFYILASQLRISRYANLGRDLNRWRQWLATNGPILTRLDCDQAWMNADQTNGDLDNYLFVRPAGHAVALVGYTEDRFIVRNSWGIDWGDGGFAYASQRYAQDAFTEAYGVAI